MDTKQILEELGAAGDDVQLLRLGYAAARLEIESLKALMGGTREATGARWYMVNNDSMATLCADREDAENTAADAQTTWPNMGPHRAVQLAEVALIGASQAHPVGAEPAWWRKPADEIEADVARSGSTAAMSCYTKMRQLLQAAAAPQPAAQALDARELRSILQDVTSVAITMLYASHKTDVLAEFNLAELTAVSTASDGLQPSAVEKIYRRGFDAAIAAQQGGA